VSKGVTSHGTNVNEVERVVFTTQVKQLVDWCSAVKVVPVLVTDGSLGPDLEVFTTSVICDEGRQQVRCGLADTIFAVMVVQPVTETLQRLTKVCVPVVSDLGYVFGVPGGVSKEGNEPFGHVVPHAPFGVTWFLTIGPSHGHADLASTVLPTVVFVAILSTLAPIIKEANLVFLTDGCRIGLGWAQVENEGSGDKAPQEPNITKKTQDGVVVVFLFVTEGGLPEVRVVVGNVGSKVQGGLLPRGNRQERGDQ
jgi:hypothetical protein